MFTRPVLAVINVSLIDSDVTLSKELLFAGDSTRVYARINNSGDEDVLGYAIFSDNNKQISAPQYISIKKDSFDDVFVDWKVTGGDHKIELNIFSTNNSDNSPQKIKVWQKIYSIDADTDSDGIGDKTDSDIDGDGLTNEEEKTLGTNSYKPDSDGDGINDKIDAFPLNKSEFRDTNNNGIGDNKDPDADGDELNNEEEIKTYGTNPLSSDSDNDGVLDGKEIKDKTDPNKKDTDGDGLIDSEDPLPLDASSFQAGFMNSIAAFFKNREYLYFILGGVSLPILYLLFRRKGRRRR